jgi:hypothetical protein
LTRVAALSAQGDETMTQHTTSMRPRPASGRAVLRTATALGVISLAAGCNLLDELVNVEAPSRIDAEVLEQPGNAGTLLDGAIGDFECAFGMYVLFQGVMSDELQWAQGSESWRAIDARDIVTTGFEAAYAFGTCSNPHQGQVPGVYKPLQTARYQADHLLELLQDWTAAGLAVPDRESVEATAAAYAGYSYLLLGESMCSAAFDLGPEVAPPDIFALAEARFTTAINGAASLGDDAILTMARVGRARARADVGRLADALADAELVPAGFVQTAGFSTISPRRENQVFVRSVRGENVTVQEPFRNTGDPRIAVADQGRTTGTGIPIWYQLKYSAADTPIPLATWEEARLIVAEAELAAGNLQASVDAINEVRSAAGLADFSSSDPDEIRDQLLLERKMELFLESHRLGDIRRFALPLDPPAGTIYPLGGVYEDDRCLPIPDVERDNNPNIP